jgi:hypothetical protein
MTVLYSFLSILCRFLLLIFSRLLLLFFFFDFFDHLVHADGGGDGTSFGLVLLPQVDLCIGCNLSRRVDETGAAIGSAGLSGLVAPVVAAIFRDLLLNCLEVVIVEFHLISELLGSGLRDGLRLFNILIV